MKKNNSNKELNVFNKTLYVFIVTIIFTLAFTLLIKKQQGDNLGDITNTSFNVKSVYGKTLVAKDLDMIYPKYYVAYFDGNDYIIHTFNYYNTESQYDLEFQRLLYSIVDYNHNDNMIRCELTRGIGNYDYVKNIFKDIVNANNLTFLE